MEGKDCSDPVRVAVASLVKLVGLLGAEMLVGRHRDDIDAFEQNVRAKLFAHVEGVNQADTAAGVALAHSLIEPVLVNLRERVKVMQAASQPPFAPPGAAPRRLN